MVSKKISKEKNITDKMYIIWIIVGIIVIFIVILFLLKIFKVNSNVEDNKNNLVEKYAICTNNSNTINYVQGNTKKTYIKHIFHSESGKLNDTICDVLKTMAYNYDVSAEVICGSQDYYANYHKKDSFESTVNDFTNNQKNHCLVYNNKENTEKDKIVGSWCGYYYDDTDLKYKFNNDGTVEKTGVVKNTGTEINFKGYYGIENNNISYGEFTTSTDYYLVLLENYFIYDENSDTIILTSKWKNDKYNVFHRCD